jgi:hypothetical protein
MRNPPVVMVESSANFLAHLRLKATGGVADGFWCRVKIARLVVKLPGHVQIKIARRAGLITLSLEFDKIFFQMLMGFPGRAMVKIPPSPTKAVFGSKESNNNGESCGFGNRDIIDRDHRGAGVQHLRVSQGREVC